MSTLTGVSYLDYAARLDPDDKVAAIIELLGDTNEILQDMITVEGNLQTGHQTTVRTGLPDVTWRLLNYGVPPSKSVTSKITDTCGMLEAYAEVDKSLADLNGNSAAWRLSEDRAFLEAMNQEMASTLFYGTQATDPEEFTGIAPRYAALGTDPDVSTYNAVNGYSSASGSDQTSMYLVVWGENTVHGIYPKGSNAGFQHQDLGEQTLLDAANGRYQGYRTHYKWDLGLTVRDWRYVVRLCNLDTSAITTSTVDLFSGMIDAYTRIPSTGMGKPVFYCNRTIYAWLWKQALAKSNMMLSMEKPEGKPVMSFMGIPIRRCDAILNTESVIS